MDVSTEWYSRCRLSEVILRTWTRRIVLLSMQSKVFRAWPMDIASRFDLHCLRRGALCMHSLRSAATIVKMKPNA